MHGRGRVSRRAALHQPPLRLLLHPEAQLRQPRLPARRVLGTRQGRGTAQSGTQRDVPGIHAGCHRRNHGLARQKGGNRQPDKHGDGGRQGAQRLRGGTLLRQPVLPLRLQGVHRRPARGRTALLHRQVRRRYRQLDVAQTYGRLLHFPHLRRQGQRARTLQRGQRAIQAEEIFQDLYRRRSRRGFHLHLRLSRQHARICDLRRGTLHRRDFRPCEDSPAHDAPRNHEEIHGREPGRAHTLLLEICERGKRLEEMAGGVRRHREKRHSGGKGGL